MTTEKWLELGGIWFTGLGTLGAVVAALGLPKLYRPRLRAICDLDSFACSTFVTESQALGQGVEELWVKLGVLNPSNTLAEDVQVRVILVIRDARSSRAKFKSYSSRWLKLSGMSAIGIAIPPRFTQFVDLCFVHLEPEAARNPLHLAGVRPSMESWEVERLRICQSPSLTLDSDCVNTVVFAVSGRNTPAAYYEIDLEYAASADTPPPRGEEAVRSALQVNGPRRIDRNIHKIFRRSATRMVEAS
jgi:hypothetical protein